MFEYFIYHYGTQLLTAILCALFGSLAYAAKQLATKYVNDDTKRSIAREAMLFVEQVWNIPSMARTSWPRHWKPPKRF